MSGNSTTKIYLKAFAQAGEFQAYHAACRWLEARGISHGRMQGPAPIGLLAGECDIAKWRNLSPSERECLDGLMTGDFRSGPVLVRLRAGFAATIREGAPSHA